MRGQAGAVNVWMGKCVLSGGRALYPPELRLAIPHERLDHRESVAKGEFPCLFRDNRKKIAKEPDCHFCDF